MADTCSVCVPNVALFHQILALSIFTLSMEMCLFQPSPAGMRDPPRTMRQFI